MMEARCDLPAGWVAIGVPEKSPSKDDGTVVP